MILKALLTFKRHRESKSAAMSGVAHRYDDKKKGKEEEKRQKAN